MSVKEDSRIREEKMSKLEILTQTTIPIDKIKIATYFITKIIPIETCIARWQFFYATTTVELKTKFLSLIVAS